MLVPYCMGLEEKIENPTSKNLPVAAYIWIGLVFIFLIALNIKWLYYDRRKRNM